MMHYNTNGEEGALIKKKGLYLVDSGGQYHDGTTDITRTIATGKITEEENRDYTLVVKAHIALNRIVFLEGCTGTNLDIIARQPIWAEYMDYKCGTGHGVAYVGSVHEGPASIRKEIVKNVIRPGMIVTNEPGIYKESSHGIRIENTLLVREKAVNDMGTFLDFEVISYCPIDTRCIDRELLTVEELVWLNGYHKKVYNLLYLYLDEEVRIWLEDATRPI
jgi:Xaa-Pro aminopeptidase